MTNAAAADLTAVDRYLALWDAFAQGDKSLVPSIKEQWPAAEAALRSALLEKDPRAPSRVVFLTVVQVGGAIPVDSAMGRAWKAYAPEFPEADLKGQKQYFAGDFWAWWVAHKSEKHDLQLLQEWARRDFARTTVIPMYERLARSKR